MRRGLSKGFWNFSVFEAPWPIGYLSLRCIAIAQLSCEQCDYSG